MADEVNTEFVADAERYIGPVEEMKAAVDGLRDALLEANRETHGLRDGLAEVAGATDGNTIAMAELRDKLAEVALAADAAKHELKGVADAEAEDAGGSFLDGLMGAFSSIKDFTSSLSLMKIVLASLPVLVPFAAALASGLTAAGLGLGAFALLAVHGLDQIKNGYTSVTQAQQAYRAAVQLEAKDPSKTNAQAVTTALAKLRIAWQDLSPAARRGVEGIDHLKSAYDKMAKAFTPDAMKVFDDGLKIANELLPQVKPFADTAATSLDRMLKDVAGFFEPAQRAGTALDGMSQSTLRAAGAAQQSLSPWQQFLAYMHNLEGPALSAIGHGLSGVGTNLLRLLQVMSKKDVVNALNIAFTILSGSIRVVTGFVRTMMITWDDLGRAIDWTRRHVDEWARDVRKSLDGVVTTIRHQIDTWDRFRDDVIRAVEQAGEAVIRFAESMSLGLLEWISRTVTDVNQRWDQGWTAVVTFARSIPSKILGALGSLGGLLVSEGAALIRGLISGIESAIPGLESAISFVRGLVSSITGLISRATGAAASAGGGGAHGALAGLAGGHAGPALAVGGGGGGALNINVHVDMHNVMSTPRAQQALAAHVQEAIGDFASRAAGSFLVLPGKSAGR